MLITQLTRGGGMTADALYEPPYTEIAPHGPEDLFPADTVNRIFAMVNRFGSTSPPASEDVVGDIA